MGIDALVPVQQIAHIFSPLARVSYFIHFQLSWLLIFLLMFGLIVPKWGCWERKTFFLFVKLRSFQLLFCFQNKHEEYAKPNCTGGDAVKHLRR